MSVVKRRPVFLNLLKIKFPMTAIISILHRVSGFSLLFSSLFAVWVLSFALSSAYQFEMVQTWFHNPVMKAFISLLFLGFSVHLFAGLRHLLMDFGFFEERTSGKVSAHLSMVFALVSFFLFLGYLYL